MSFITYTVAGEHDVKSRLDIAEYPRAWAEYNRRWYASWGVPLILVGCYISSWAFGGERIQTLLILAAGATYIALYLRFMRWPCPRCGEQFTMGHWRRIERSDRCINCGLPRNAEGKR